MDFENSNENFETKPLYRRTPTTMQKIYQRGEELKKDVKICETNPIHWTNKSHNQLHGIFARNVPLNDK